MHAYCSKGYFVRIAMFRCPFGCDTAEFLGSMFVSHFEFSLSRIVLSLEKKQAWKMSGMKRGPAPLPSSWGPATTLTKAGKYREAIEKWKLVRESCENNGDMQLAIYAYIEIMACYSFLKQVIFQFDLISFSAASHFLHSLCRPEVFCAHATRQSRLCDECLVPCRFTCPF